MGTCSSCLGRDAGRDRDLSDEDESARLLFDDAHANQYGSFGEHHIGAVPADPQEVQRETEALQKVVAQTSNRLVDIFALVPQTGPPAPTVFPAQDAKILRYQDALVEMSVHDQSGKGTQLSSENTPNVSDGWISEEEDDGEEMQRHQPVKSEGIGPLLGGFADTEPAMG